jgi:hypothetical protein
MTREEGIPTGKVLDHPHHRVINGLIAVGVIFTEDIPNHASTFPIRAIGR